MTMTYATMRGVATGGVIALLIHLYVNLATDFENGKNDPFGPYPRIPDKERLKKELEFAEECKKFITPPKEIY